MVCNPDEHDDDDSDEQQRNQMATLANQIIAAMPERIKLSPSRTTSDVMPPCSSGRLGGDVMPSALMTSQQQLWTRRERSSSYDSFSSVTSSNPDSISLPQATAALSTLTSLSAALAAQHHHHHLHDSGISTPLLHPGGGGLDDYRCYPELGTPGSSSASPCSLSGQYGQQYGCGGGGGGVDHFSMDSPPPTTAEFNEYFNAPQMFLDKDFSQLTLSGN